MKPYTIATVVEADKAMQHHVRHDVRQVCKAHTQVLVHGLDSYYKDNKLAMRLGKLADNFKYAAFLQRHS